MKNKFSNQTVVEEIGNSLTHGIGAYLSAAALALLVAGALKSHTLNTILSMIIYGSSLVILYTASTLYHAFWPVRLKRIFNIFDNIGIYILIAGTYTPILIVAGGEWGHSLLVFQWTMVIAGTVMKALFPERFRVLSTAIYVVMGWSFAIALDHLVASLPGGLFPWIVAGGICYTAGVVFYLWENLRFSHVIWHLFVLAGSILHFFGIYFYIIP